MPSSYLLLGGLSALAGKVALAATVVACLDMISKEPLCQADGIHLLEYPSEGIP